MRGSVPLLGVAILVGLAAVAVPASHAVEARPASQAPSPRPAHPSGAGALRDAAGAEVTREALLQRAAEADFILVGESHTSRCDHLAQARLIAQLAEEGLHPAVGLEMVAVDQQRVLDLFNERRIPASRMGAALDWGFYWGVDYALYQPIFAVAERFGLPVVALNIPGRTARVVVDREIPLERIAPDRLVPPQAVPPPAEQLASLRREWEAHAAMLPKQRRRPFSQLDPFERFIEIQSLWDTKMAQEAARARARFGGPVVVLAGTGHIENGWGIPSRLRRALPEARLLTVIPSRGEQPLDPKAADLFYSCPRRHPLVE